MALPIEDIALSFVPNLGVRGAVHLLDYFGSAEAIFKASRDELCEGAALRDDIARAIVAGCGLREAEKEVAYCQKHDIVPLASNDSRYPALLREVDDRPAVLYVMGNVEALSRRAVAFVGTRKMTPYGERITTELVEGLHSLVPDVSIVSGLAYGIDGSAHRAAVGCGAPSVGVIANSLPSIQPVAHKNLAHEMIRKGGAVVTELHSQVRQNGRYFIPRNRLIAALSAGVVVVETPDSGGSLSTASFADGYARTVMAVPGRATDHTSLGCNRLIRDRVAQMVLSGFDIASELMWEFSLDAPPAPDVEKLPLMEAEQAFMVYFTSEPVSFDELMQRSGMSSGALSLMLMNLELSGAIRQLPGKIYEKLI